MFRIGGGVDSQGTGITSGMDMPRKNFEHGGPHDYDYWSEKVPEAFESMRSILGPATLIKGAEALRNVGSIWDIPGALGSPEMLGAVGTGLVTDKKLDLQEAKTMAKLTKPDKPGEIQTKLDLLGKAKTLLKDAGGWDKMSSAEQSQWMEWQVLALGSAAPDTKAEAWEVARKIIMQEEELAGIPMPREKRNKAIDELSLKIYRQGLNLGLDGNAEGGIPTRVNRVGLQESFPGTVGEGQNVMQGEGAAVMEAYNKEAFQDFANIQTQDDVTMFNDKWGVQLVVDVGSA